MTETTQETSTSASDLESKLAKVQALIKACQETLSVLVLSEIGLQHQLAQLKLQDEKTRRVRREMQCFRCTSEATDTCCDCKKRFCRAHVQECECCERSAGCALVLCRATREWDRSGCFHRRHSCQVCGRRVRHKRSTQDNSLPKWCMRHDCAGEEDKS